MEKKLTLVKSVIDRSRKQKDTVKALGLGKTKSSVVVKVNPQIAGMIKKVEHLLKVEDA